MFFQVNYKYVADSGKLRSAALVLDAADTKAARSAATKQIKAEFDHFEITSIKTFGKNAE